MTLTNFLKNKNNLILTAIIILAIFLIFFRLTRADVQTDGAHYAFRAIGYLDFMLSQIQTTPIQWFKVVPWWGWLSMHDHPPLFFLIQHLFFILFGVSSLTALLPTALAAVGSVILLYLIGKEIYRPGVGILAAFLLTVSTFFIWMSRVNFLEGLETFFILLTILFFFKALKNDRYFLLLGLFLGLTFLTKYTAFFLPLVFISYLLINNRKLFFNKKLILGGLITLLVFSPVIVYNLMMFKSRGHFDIQLSSIFGFTFEAAQKDWPLLFKADGEKIDLWSNFLGVRSGLKQSYSLPFYLLILISAASLLIRFFIKIKSRPDIFLLLSIIFLTLFFTFFGSTHRYLPIYTPFLALVVAVVLLDLKKYLKDQLPTQRFLSYLPLVVAAPIVFFEIFYNLNTNLVNQPIGQKNFYYSTIRLENAGFNELEKYLTAKFKTKPYFSPKIKKITKFSEMVASLTEIQDRDVFIYESNLKWFSTLWYLQRYLLYHDVYFVSDLDLANSLGVEENWFNFFQKNGANNIYFIRGIAPLVFGPQKDEYRRWLSEQLEASYQTNLASGLPGGVEEVKDRFGQLVFKIYYLKLK